MYGDDRVVCEWWKGELFQEIWFDMVFVHVNMHRLWSRYRKCEYWCVMEVDGLKMWRNMSVPR